MAHNLISDSGKLLKITMDSGIQYNDFPEKVLRMLFFSGKNVNTDAVCRKSSRPNSDVPHHWGSKERDVRARQTLNAQCWYNVGSQLAMLGRYCIKSLPIKHETLICWFGPSVTKVTITWLCGMVDCGRP